MLRQIAGFVCFSVTLSCIPWSMRRRPAHPPCAAPAQALPVAWLVRSSAPARPRLQGWRTRVPGGPPREDHLV